MHAIHRYVAQEPMQSKDGRTFVAPSYRPGPAKASRYVTRGRGRPLRGDGSASLDASPRGQHHQAAEQTAREQVDHREDHSEMIPTRQAAQARSSNRALQVRRE